MGQYLRVSRADNFKALDCDNFRNKGLSFFDILHKNGSFSVLSIADMKKIRNFKF